jgi:hypothetical protein
LKSSALLTPDPNVMEIFVLLMTGKLQLGIILIALVVIFVFLHARVRAGRRRVR